MSARQSYQIIFRSRSDFNNGEHDFQIIFQIVTFGSLVASAALRHLVRMVSRVSAPKIRSPSWALRCSPNSVVF